MYTPDYYRSLEEGARRSARVIVPLVMDLVSPKRVVDVGCGVGTWLSVFREFGVEDVWGIDGEHIPSDMLEIPEERFLSLDLERPIQMQSHFDLVISLEVAEHLSPSAAENFVRSLTGLAPVVLFSAAIPAQGGEHHVNEQWPDYWAERFRASDYVAVDCVRRRVWEDERVEWWYAQNMLLFAAPECFERNRRLLEERVRSRDHPLALVHPKRYLELLDWCLRKVG